MIIDQVLHALDAGDEGALQAYTRETIRLRADAWPYVAEALWRCRGRLERMSSADNPAAYIRRVALRLQHKAEQSVLGKHVVYDETGRNRIGYVVVGSYYSNRGTLVDPQPIRERGAALGFIPDAGVDGVSAAAQKSERQKRAERAQSARPVEATDDDERAVLRAQRRGISRREMPAYLGIERRRVESAWKRLYRKRTR